jgi:guanylate kinase
MSSSARRGQLFVVSAPSGAGKTTVVEGLIAATAGVRRSRSYTSRRARPGETDGVDYHFVSRPRFEAMIAGGQFDTERELVAGADLVLVIDVQGARQVRRHRPSSVLVFVLPPSAAVLEARLRNRGEESEADIGRRLEAARGEVRAVAEYDYVVVNDAVEACVDRLRAIVVAERSRTVVMGSDVAAIQASFDAEGRR